MEVSSKSIRLLLKYTTCTLLAVVCACSSEGDTPRGMTPSPLPERRRVVDSLARHISEDTLSLLNWLALNQTTDDLYERSVICLQLGIYHQSNHLYQTATEYHLLSLQTATIAGDKDLIIRSLNALGRDYNLRREYGESADCYFKALALLEQQGSEKAFAEIERVNTFRGLGALYLALGQTDEAMNYFKRSLEYAKRQGLAGAVIESLAGIGAVHEQEMEYDSAYHYYDQCLHHSLGSSSASGTSLSFERIGNICRLRGDLENAMLYTTRAYQALEDTPEKLYRLRACFSLAGLNIQRGDFPEARKLLHEGMAMAERLPLAGYQEQGHRLYSELYKQQGLAAKALEERALSDGFAHDAQNKQNLNAVLRGRIGYEKRKGEAEKNTMLQQFRQKEKKTYYALAGNLLAIVALVAFLIILARRFRLWKRDGLALLRMEQLKTAFCARLSQGFKTPVGIIIGMIEQIKDDLPLDEKNHVAINILSRQTESLYTLANEVTSIAHLQGSVKPSEMKDGNVVAYLQYLYECFAVLTENKRVTYAFHSNVSELFTVYQPDYLRAILNNLLDDAMRHCTEGDRVTVRVTRDWAKKNYSIGVAHTGNVPPGDGMGIGESLARRLAEKIGGWIEANEAGGEAVLSATFPLPRNPSLETESPIAIYRVPADTGGSIEQGFHGNRPPLGKPTVILVQENKYLAYYLSTLLQDKLQISVTTDGNHALQSANDNPPDLIISDARLPRDNAFELCKKIKGSALLLHVPVILLTTTNARAERVEGFASGADACLEKPLHEDELMAVINQLLSSRKQIRDTYARETAMNRVNAPVDAGNEENIDFLQRVTNAVYKNIANTENIIERLSSEMCLSTSQLNRRIKAITGMTTSNYILKTRLAKAKKQLITSQKPIGDIAMQCGFNDFAYFSRSFKREFGMTPTTFQRLPISAR